MLPGITRIASAEKEPCGERGHVSLIKLGRAWRAIRKRACWPGTQSLRFNRMFVFAPGSEMSDDEREKGTNRHDAVANPEGLVAGP